MFECSNKFMEYWTGLRWKFTSDENNRSPATAMKSWLVITSGNLFLLAGIPKLNRRMKQAGPAFGITLEQGSSSKLSGVWPANSYFEILKGRCEFSGCAVCYSIIFMLSSKKGKCHTRVSQSMLFTDSLLPSLWKWNLSEWNSLWKNPTHPADFVYSFYLRSHQREEKPILYSATSS